MRIEVGVTPLRTGNLRYGYQDVAITVREDQNIDAKERTKAVIFNNLLDARLDTILIPLAQRMISPAQQTAINRDAYFTATVLQTIARELTSVNRGSNDKSQGFDPLSRSLGEARAGVVGVFLARWLAANRMISKRELHGVYVSYVADLLRTSRFGSGEPHGRAAMAQFNALVEVQAIRQDASGRYSVDDAAMPEAVSLLCKQLLAFGATGDDAGAAAWFAKYGSSAPAPLATALDAAKDLPVDFIPSYDLSHGDRP